MVESEKRLKALKESVQQQGPPLPALAPQAGSAPQGGAAQVIDMVLYGLHGLKCFLHALMRRTANLPRAKVG